MDLHNSLNKSFTVMGDYDTPPMEEKDGVNQMNPGKIFTAASVARRLKQKLSTPPVDKNEIKHTHAEKDLSENQRSINDSSEKEKIVKSQAAAAAASSEEEEEERLSKSSSSMASPQPPPSSSSSTTSPSTSSTSSTSSIPSSPLLPPTLLL